MQTNSIAKINSPVVNNVLFRERLFQTLDRARKKKSIWITGLPGSGKTTLVASYLSAKKLPHGWYHIDSSDADLATFFYYLRYVVRKLTPSKSLRLPLLTPEYLANIQIYAHIFFESLYSMLPKGFVLVFDNYHEINSNPLFHNLMNEALMRIPEHGNMIFISRTEPPVVFSILMANSLMEIVGNETIKFTPEETNALVKLRYGRDHDNEVVTSLHNWTDGWAAGIILMLEQYKMGIENTEKGILKDYQSIFDYFSAEIFDKMEPSTQDFLLRTCFFPSVTIEIANKITGNQSSEKVLNYLINAHYFTIKHRNNTYKYHDLFREFLLERTKVYFNEAKLRQIYKQAAMILKENDKIEDAIGLFQKAGDWENIKRIIIANAQALIAQGRNKVLEAWIKSFPYERLDQDPWLLYWLGEAHTVFNPIEGRVYFEKAFTKFLNEGLDSNSVYSEKKLLSDGVYLAWCGIIETFIYEYGNFAPINKWIRAIEHIMREHHKFPSREIEARVLSLLVFALVHYNPSHPKLALWVDRTLKLLKHVKDPEERVYYLFSILHYNAWTGNIFKRGALEEITKISKDYTIKTKLFQKMHSAAYARMFSSKEECLNFIHDGLDIADKSGVHFLDHMIIVQAVYFFLGVDDLKKAEEYFQKMAPSVNRVNALHVIQYDTLSGWLDYLHGNTKLALEKIEKSLELSIKAHIPFAQGLCRLALAQVLYEQGAYKNAEEHNKRALLIGKRMKSNLLILSSYCIEAYWFLNEKQSSHALEVKKRGLRILKKAMGLGRKYGMVNVYFVWGRMMTKLCIEALENGIEVKYVRQLIQKLELFPDTPPYECEAWPWEFKFYSLGSFRILKNDMPIKLFRKAQIKPIELLQFLFANHERAVELDQISSALWPDAQGDYAHQSLDTTIHRLRKMLGSNDAVISQAGRLMLNTKKCWVDMLAFEHHLDKIEQLLTINDLSERQKKIKFLETRIFNLYRGDFFTQNVVPLWAMGFMEQLHDRFTHFIEQLGMYYEGRGDMRNAIKTYKKGLETDKHVELFYQRLMVIYKSLGRYAEATALYKRCAQILSQTFGIEPSDKTKELFQSIIK